MVLLPDQLRVCTMLKDTIILLCKNGLTFKTKFCIEAVIGVTLDDEQMFHISMNEIIKSATAPEEDSLSEASTNGVRNRGRKRKKRVKTENNHSASSTETSGDSFDRGKDRSPKRVHVKGEPELEQDDSEDLVFVKQEMDENWPQSFSNFTQQQQQEDQNFSSLSDLNLTPVTTATDAGLWAASSMSSQQYMTPVNRMQRAPPAATTINQPGMSPLGSPAQPGMSPMTIGDQSMQQMRTGLSVKYKCQLCEKAYLHHGSLRKHTKAMHEGIFPNICELCGKGFMHKDNLLGHMSSHGENAYSCETCGKTFGWKASRDSHVKQKHPEILLRMIIN